MKVSAKYQRALESYLQWELVTTPATGTFQESRRNLPNISISGPNEAGLSAAEALCQWESTGKPCEVRPSEYLLLMRYIHGKAQRDWWTKELKLEIAFIPEEYLGFLGPLPFIELFGRAPITRIVRYFHDNRYSLWEWRLDNFMLSKAVHWGMHYYERDDRHSALQNARRMVTVKWIDPFLYKLKAKLRRIA